MITMRIIAIPEAKPTIVAKSMEPPKGVVCPAIVDHARDTEHMRAKAKHLSDMGGGRLHGAETPCLHPGPRGIGGYRAPRIAVGGDRDPACAEMPRHRHGRRLPPRLERSGGQPPFILDQQTPAPFAQSDERRHRLAQRHTGIGMGHGQQFAVTPHIGRSLRQHVPVHAPPRGGQIIAGEQRFARWRKSAQAVGRDTLGCHRTFQMGEIAGPAAIVGHGGMERSGCARGSGHPSRLPRRDDDRMAIMRQSDCSRA
jgi:hypothetical protein